MYILTYRQRRSTARHFVPSYRSGIPISDRSPACYCSCRCRCHCHCRGMDGKDQPPGAFRGTYFPYRFSLAVPLEALWEVRDAAKPSSDPSHA